MSKINDFKTIKRKSYKYLEFLANELDIDFTTMDTIQVERLGFYLFVIEHLTNLNDVFDVTDTVSDTEFNKIIFDDKFDDAGIDAIFVDDIEKHIKLFNFKYREKFKAGKQSVNSTIVSSKFINSITTENTSSLEGKTKKGADEIIERLNSNDEYKMTLYIVSNEDIEIQQKDSHLKIFEENYGLEVISVGLHEISQFIALRPEAIHAELIVDNDAIMSFSESSISSSKSYILRLPLSEIIRITCNNKNLRDQYSIEDISPLANVDIDYSVLFDNVRGLVVKSKFNKNIYKSLKNDPSKFFMYNNGLTLTANSINAESVNANKKVRISLNSIQVLNGGQSLRTIHNFNSDDSKHLEDYLAKSEILVRIFNTSENTDLNNKIAEYTNSQNSISNVDLKSLRSEQLEIEKYLNEYDIVYARKSGDTGIDDTKRYKHKISMEKFGQILISANGMPHKATNNKKDIFGKYYQELFVENFSIEKSPKLIESFFDIKKLYELTTYEVSEQKLFYIVYATCLSSEEIQTLIDLLETSIMKYTPTSGKVISEARKLIQLNFKEFFEDELKKILEI